jgi:hypothetical protein
MEDITFAQHVLQLIALMRDEAEQQTRASPDDDYHVGYLEACEQILSVLQAGFAELFGAESRDEPDEFNDHEDMEGC